MGGQLNSWILPFLPFQMAPENPSAWRDFLKISLIVKQCDSTAAFPQWRKFFVCVTTILLLVLGTWQIFRLCLIPPRVGKDNKHFTIDEIVFCKVIKLNFHDISLITKAISLYSNITLLYDVLVENHDSLLNSIGFNVSMLFLRIVLTVAGYACGIIKGDYGDILREGSLYIMLIFHLIQLSCVTHNFYKRCTFFV